MPFDLNLGMHTGYLGEQQPEYFSLGLNGYDFYQNPGNYASADPVGEALVAKKKKRWLDTLGEKLAGDRYVGTTEDDRRLAMSNAMIALGRQFTQAAGKGDWGAFGQAIGNGMGDASQAFQGTMGDLQDRRIRNEDLEIKRKAQKNAMTRDDIATEEAQYTAEQRKQLQSTMKQELDNYETLFDKTVRNDDGTLDDDVTEEQYNAWKAILAGKKRIALSDPRNPAYTADIGEFILATSEKTGRTEAALKSATPILIASALHDGYVSKDGVPNITGWLKFKGLQNMTELNKAAAYIDATYANRDESLARARNIDAQTDAGVDVTLRKGQEYDVLGKRLTELGNYLTDGDEAPLRTTAFQKVLAGQPLDSVEVTMMVPLGIVDIKTGKISQDKALQLHTALTGNPMPWFDSQLGKGTVPSPASTDTGTSAPPPATASGARDRLRSDPKLVEIDRQHRAGLITDAQAEEQAMARLRELGL